MKSQRSDRMERPSPNFQATRHIARLACIALILALLGSLPAFAAGPGTTQAVTMIGGTVGLDPAVTGVVATALDQNQARLNGAAFFAPTDVRSASRWLFVSVAGFREWPAGMEWRLEQAAWLGLVLVTFDSDGRPSAALQGSDAFAREVDKMPDDVLGRQAREDLTGTGPAGPNTYYRFPWQSGTSMYYGEKGVHNSDFGMNGKAVDFLSDGNTGAGHAPNDLLAAASGSISYVCRDSLSVAIKIGDLLYAHLMDNGNLTMGHSFSQGESMGQMRVGGFDANCGYAQQTEPWFHVHWAFPDTGSFDADGWTLRFDTQIWYRGDQTVSMKQWMTASGSACGCGCGTLLSQGSDRSPSTHFAGIPVNWAAEPPWPPAASTIVQPAPSAPPIPNITRAGTYELLPPGSSSPSPAAQLREPAQLATTRVTEARAPQAGARAPSALPVNEARPASASYALRRTVLASDGGVKTSTSYRVKGTGGQVSETEPVSSAGYRVRPGFWGARACVFGGLTAKPSISESRPALTLKWTAVTGATAYAIYRGASPYFALGTPYAETDKTEWTDSNGGGDVAVNYTYVVTPANQCGGPTVTYRVGEFDFELKRGN